MKRMTLVLCVLMLAAFVGTANADVGNNPNSFELDMNCSGETVHITVPVKMAGAGQVSDGRIGISHSHYIDFNDDGRFEDDELVFANGKAHQMTFCTWTWGNDPYLHGMDIQFVAPK